MVKYRKLFLDEIKSLFLYLVKFLDDGSMLSKEYLYNYIVGSLDHKTIIMIIYNKSTFFINDSH